MSSGEKCRLSYPPTPDGSELGGWGGSVVKEEVIQPEELSPEQPLSERWCSEGTAL